MTGIRYLEDFTAGEVTEFGRYEVTEEEVLEFARDFDDQPFHTDREAAKDSIYGGLIASGWHTCAMMMRMICDHRVAVDGQSAVIASPGFDDLKWLKPVRPGDILSVRSEIIAVEPSRSKPDRGHLRIRNRVLNQKDEVVAEMINLAIMRRRPT
jgi:acyl dehydratase